VKGTSKKERNLVEGWLMVRGIRSKKEGILVIFMEQVSLLDAGMEKGET
jgi:hypothetical protein